MRLVSVEIRDYRSLFLDGSNRPFQLDLAEGSNTLVGQNNCGKSNVLRAISLALDPNHPYVPDVDRPGPRSFAHPIITLTFQGDGSREEDATVLYALDAYEQAVHGETSSGPSLFVGGQRQFGLEVSFVPSPDGVHRRERLLLGDISPQTKISDEVRELRERAVDALRASVRFVLISTGESIESVLEGNFREILHSVVRDRLQTDFEDAERSRQEYIRGLQDSLLGPLRTQLADDIRGMFPEIEALTLSPEVSSIEQTLSHVGINLNDVVSTPLSRKGTGVRGGVLVAMLSYLALNATRSMVLAVEEPEAFLHPAAQEDLRDHLERVADVTGVTLLVTTHSPFIISRSQEGRVFCLAKDKEGRTRVSESARGDTDHAPLIGGLLRESSLERVLAAAATIPEDARSVVLLEGEGDVFCLELTARLLGRPDLLEGLALLACQGTLNMIAQAVITSAATELPIVLVVDNDEPGRKVKDTLVGNTFGFSKKQLLSYWQVFDGQPWSSFPVEAEDVFAPELLEAFVVEHGESVIQGKQRRPDGAWHYDLDQSAKELLGIWFETKAQPAHLERWVRMIQHIRTAARLEQITETPAEIIAGAAPPSAASEEQHGDGDVLVLAGQHDYARYQADGAIVLPDGVDPGPNLTHVAFYNRSVQPHVPAVLADLPNLLFAQATVEQLRETGKPADCKVADFIESALQSPGDVAAGRVLLLSDPDDEDTLRLDHPVQNTKKINGRPVAWTIGPKLVPYRAFATEPGTTDELDDAISNL